LLTAQYANARSIIPGGFKATTDLLSDSSKDPGLRTQKKLPLVSEILSRLKESADATHFIYSNVDICVMPYFYSAVEYYIQKGHDALVINRRRIRNEFMDEKNLAAAYAESGKKHPGFDCFVFRRELLDKFIGTKIYISAPPAGSDIFYNIFTFAENPVLFTEKHLTFHVGMELVKEWGEETVCDHNQREFISLIKALKPQMQIAKFPGAGYGFIRRHFKWLMNPAFHYPTMASVDFKQLSSERRKPIKEESTGAYYEWLFEKTGFRDGA
jgi:hypothetical protein